MKLFYCLLFVTVKLFIEDLFVVCNSENIIEDLLLFKSKQIYI